MRGWIKQLFENQYLPAVRDLGNSPEDKATAETWANWMKDRFSEHGFSLPQQRNPMTEVRTAIKAILGQDHIAFATMNFSTDEWFEINTPIGDKAAKQNENQRIIDPKTVNAIVTRATNLLKSREWFDIAAGLAVLSGRRSTEILKTATFTQKTPYSITFTGALKRGSGEKQVSFEIPTLCQAEYIIQAIDKLRAILPTQDLTNEQINKRYSDQVAQACDRHFKDLVEPVDGKENLYTHLFRKVYTCLATYFYCPKTVDDIEFQAQIQGHFAGRDNLTQSQKRSITSGRHYRAYVVMDDQGNMRRGIRLGEWQGVEPIEPFNHSNTVPTVDDNQTSEDQPMATKPKAPKATKIEETTPKVIAEETTATTPATPAKRGNLRINQSDSHTWAELLQELFPDHPNQQGRMSALLELLNAEKPRLLGQNLTTDTTETTEQDEPITPAQSQPEAVEQPSAAVVSSFPTVDHFQAVIWFQARIDQLERENAQCQEERDQAIANQGTGNHAEIEHLRAENERLAGELAQAQTKLETFRQLLNGNGSPAPTRETTIASAPIPSRASTSASAPIASPKPAPVRVVPRTPTDESTLDPDVVAAVRAIMSYNDEPGRAHPEKWAISFPVMKDLLKGIGKATQPKINAVFQGLAQEIEDHHRQHALGERHNRVHKGQSITEFIRF